MAFRRLGLVLHGILLTNVNRSTTEWGQKNSKNFTEILACFSQSLSVKFIFNANILFDALLKSVYFLFTPLVSQRLIAMKPYITQPQNPFKLSRLVFNRVVLH